MRADDDAPGPGGQARGDLHTSRNPHPATESGTAVFPPASGSDDHSDLRESFPRVPGYEILSFVGSGSFGRVYRAREVDTGKIVAIKFFTHGPGPRWQALLEEVRLHARLDAVRGIIDLKQVVADADPPYYVMAFAERGSLADLLERRGRLPASEAIGLFRQAAEALAYVHAMGICHCDLKPANLLLDARGQVQLADFGQAQPSGDGSPALGTLFYMPPDQADSRNTASDPSWDVYALGAVFYLALTGQLPRYSPALQTDLDLQPDAASRLARYREGLARLPAPTAHRSVPGVDADLVRILDRCLALDPRRRLADAGELLAALEARDRRRRRRPLLLLGLVASIFALVLTGVTASRSEGAALDSYQRDLTGQLVESNRGSASLIASAIDLQMGQRLDRVIASVDRDLFEATRRGDRAALERALVQLMGTHDGGPTERFAETTVTNGRGELLAMVRLRHQPGSNGERRLTLQPIDLTSLRSPYDQFSWRDWYSGRGDRYEQSDRHHPPITRPHISDPYVSSHDPEGLFISLSVPIRDPDTVEGPVLGVLEAAVLMSEMSRWIRNAHLSRGGAAVLLNRRGHVLLHTSKPVRLRLGERPRMVFRKEEMAELFPRLIGTLPEFRDPIDRERQLAGYARTSQRIGWVVVVEHDRDQVLAPIHDLRSRLDRVGRQSFVGMALVVAGLWGWLGWTLRRLERGVG